MKLFPKTILSKSDLEAVAAKITEMEKTTCGEIRVVVRQERTRKEKAATIADLAVAEFFQLGMEKTRDRTGILIFILVDEHKFHIAADEGINEKVEQGTWDHVAQGMSAHFKKGEFRSGIIEAVESMGTILAQHFPRHPDDTDELPNIVIQR